MLPVWVEMEAYRSDLKQARDTLDSVAGLGEMGQRTQIPDSQDLAQEESREARRHEITHAFDISIG